MPVSYTSPGVSGGAATLILDPVQQLGYEQIPVWDGPTYLYTIYRTHFRGTYNPATFSYSLNPLPGGAPGALPFQITGVAPPTTNNATKHFLMQPRGTFVYNIGGVVTPAGAVLGGLEAIRSPTNVPGSNVNPDGTTNGGAAPNFNVSYRTDATNGPTPLHCHVIEVKGTKTFLVDWAIECAVNECYLFKSSQSLSALLSHRWTYEEDLDQDFFFTRTIKGHAIFRSDRLLALGAVADDYRAWLFHPVQNNAQRTVQQCIISDDGNRLDYVLVDREKPFNLTPTVVNLGVTRIEATYSNGYKKAINVEDLVGELVIGEALLVGGFLLRATLAGRIAGLALGMRAIGHFERASGFIPRSQKHLTVRVWGNRSSTRSNLYSVAVNVLASKITVLDRKLGSGTITASEDLMGKFVELDCVVESGPIVSNIIAGDNIVAIPVVGPDEIAGVTINDPSPQPIPVLGPAREDIYAAVANVLAGNCGVTPQANNNALFATISP